MNEPNKKEEDVVVREIDVFYIPSIDDNTMLHVLQYPLRPHWRPYELQERLQEVRVKPETGEVEIDMTVEVDSKNYNSECASRLKMSKQTLTTSWIPPPLTTSFAVGVLREDKLYLNPIHEVVQLRPSMENLKSSGETDQERWVPLKYHDFKSELSAQYLQRMMAEESFQTHFTMNPLLLTLPLEDRLKKLLHEEPLFHRFSILKRYFPDATVDEIFEVLQKHARLVQGLWVLKSSLSFTTDEYLRPFPPYECLVRDYALLLFRKKPSISLAELKFPSPQFKRVLEEMLKTLATERPSLNEWKLRENPDEGFKRLYLEIFEEQEQNWHRRGGVDKVLEYISIWEEGEEGVGESSGTTPETAMVSAGAHVWRTMADETREAMVKVLRTHKVCSLELIRKSLRDYALPEDKLWELLSAVAVELHGEVFVLKLRNTPPLRSCVMHLLQHRGKLRKSDVAVTALHVLHREISYKEFSQVMSEFCVHKATWWVLKSGDGEPT